MSFCLIFQSSSSMNLMQKDSKSAVHRQHKKLKTQMGWLFCGHFSVIGESFRSYFLLKSAFSWAAQNKTAVHKQHKITSLLINDYHLNIHIIEQHSTQLYICEHYYCHLWFILFLFLLKKPSTKKTTFHEQHKFMSSPLRQGVGEAPSSYSTKSGQWLLLHQGGGAGRPSYSTKSGRKLLLCQEGGEDLPSYSTKSRCCLLRLEGCWEGRPSSTQHLSPP